MPRSIGSRKVITMPKKSSVMILTQWLSLCQNSIGFNNPRVTSFDLTKSKNAWTNHTAVTPTGTWIFCRRSAVYYSILSLFQWVSKPILATITVKTSWFLRFENVENVTRKGGFVVCIGNWTKESLFASGKSRTCPLRGTLILTYLYTI